MKLKLPEKFAKEIIIQEHLRQLNFLETIIFYVVDGGFRKSVNLQKWLAQQLTPEALKELKGFADIKANDSNRVKCRKALEWVHTYITYKSDLEVWKVNEKWQTIKETLEKRSGDCEDGAILLYSVLVAHGVPNILLRIVAGNVQTASGEGGHCYLVWLSDSDGLEYPLDWCYWYNKSLNGLGNCPYVERGEYLLGESEWFSFNSDSAYRVKYED